MNLSEIWNTPGYFYGIGYALSTAVVVAVLTPGVSLVRRALSFAGLFSVLVGFMLLTMGAKGLTFVLSVLFILSILYFSFWHALKDKFRAGFYCVKAFIYGEFISSLVWQVYYYLALRFPALQSGAGQAAVFAVGYAVVSAAVYLVERTLHRGGVEITFTARDLLSVLITGAAVFVISNLGYLDHDGLFSGSYARDIFAIRTLVDVAGVAMLYAYHSQLREVQLRLENDALNNIMDAQYRAYQLSRESIELANQKYHDLKHQLALIRAMSESEKAADYLNHMEAELRSCQIQQQTGSAVLDAILTNKLAYCQKKGIELKFMTDGALLNFMDDMDVSALFGNMLDNAIESVETLPDPDSRLIRLLVDAERGFLRIRIGNYCPSPIRFKNGLPVTNKQDKRYHGFGMKSMQRTVAKYGGSLLAEQENGWFELKIVIPLGDNPRQIDGNAHHR